MEVVFGRRPMTQLEFVSMGHIAMLEQITLLIFLKILVLLHIIVLPEFNIQFLVLLELTARHLVKMIQLIALPRILDSSANKVLCNLQDCVFQGTIVLKDRVHQPKFLVQAGLIDPNWALRQSKIVHFVSLEVIVLVVQLNLLYALEVIFVPLELVLLCLAFLVVLVTLLVYVNQKSATLVLEDIIVMDMV